MQHEIIEKPSFTVVGKLGKGPSDTGPAWIAPLWQAANAGFAEIATLAKQDASGAPIALWGAMSDPQGTFMPWTQEGLYLAGIEAMDGATPPEGWTAWTLPAHTYLVLRTSQAGIAEAMHTVLCTLFPEKGYTLKGAVHEMYRPQDTDGTLYLYFPIG